MPARSNRGSEEPRLCLRELERPQLRHTEEVGAVREITDVDFGRARVRRNPYAARVAAEGIVHVGRGRPKKGTGTGPTVPRSVCFPAQLWKLLEAKAKAEGLTPHSAMRRHPGVGEKRAVRAVLRRHLVFPVT